MCIRDRYYPGLKSHLNHSIANQQQKYFGGVVSFDLNIDDKEFATQIVSSTKFFKLAESLGGVKSLICLPCEMTHKSIPVSYTHLRAHETVLDLVCRLLLEKKKNTHKHTQHEKSNLLNPQYLKNVSIACVALPYS